VYPGDSSSGVLFSLVEEWDQAVPMKTVLAQLGPEETKAKAVFEVDVVRITDHEYRTVLEVQDALDRT